MFMINTSNPTIEINHKPNHSENLLPIILPLENVTTWKLTSQWLNPEHHMNLVGLLMRIVEPMFKTLNKTLIIIHQRNRLLHR
jgi:hypothetical protein